MARGTRGALTPPDHQVVVLDSEGLGAASSRTGLAFAYVRAAAALDRPVVVSAVTLAEVLRGHPRDAAVHRLLKGCRVEPVSREIGRAAGELLGRTGRKDTVDAILIATVAELPRPTLVLTSDPTDLSALAAGMPGVQIEAV